MTTASNKQQINSLVKKRIFATLLDWAIILIIMIIVEIIPLILIGVLFQDSIYTDSITYNRIKTSIIVLLPIFTILGIFAIAYYYTFWQLKNNGQTIGKMNQNLQVMIEEDENELREITKDDFKITLKRFLLGIIDNLVWGLVGLLFMLTDKEQHRSLCDRFSKSIVVEKEVKTE